MLVRFLRRPIDGIPTWLFGLRVLWITTAVILTLWFGQKGAFFVYQGY